MEQQRDIEKDWEFWKEIVCNPDGSINVDQVKKELSDFSYILEQIPKIYCHITGDKLSKVMYPAETVISVADEYQEELFLERLKDIEKENDLEGEYEDDHTDDSDDDFDCI